MGYLRHSTFTFSIICILTLTACQSMVPAHDLRITNDGGGYVHLYAAQVDDVIHSGERVVIDGRCDSACTMYLAAPRTCVTKRARLGFHSAGPGLPEHIEWANQVLLDHYPPSVRTWIEQHGGLTKRVIYLKGKELQGRVRRCA